MAAPEVNGLGVTTLTSSLSRSSQPLMPFGLPLRTMNDTSEVDTKPSYGVALVQFLSTRPASTSLSTSGASEKFTTSAFRPPSTARLCSPDAPNELLKVTPLPSVVFWKAGFSSL